mgnify:CR=1 FL=1
MSNAVKDIKKDEKEEIKETKEFFKGIKEGIKTEKVNDLDELGKMKQEIKKTKEADVPSSIAKAEKKLDLDTIKNLKHETKLEAKEKIRFLKDCEKILIKIEKEEGKSSAEIIKEFNKMFDEGMKQFVKDNELSKEDKKNLVDEFKKDFK